GLSTPRLMTESLMKVLQKAKAEDELTVLLVLKERPIYLPFTVVAWQAESNIYLVKGKASTFKKYFEGNRFLFADKQETPREELTTGNLDLATNKANFSHAAYPEVNGQGILVSVKENTFDTTDIDLLNRYLRTGPVSPIITAHASIMATTIAGAGNSSPEARGVAFGSKVTAANFSSLLPEEGDHYRQQGITVQNHSYGTTIQAYYGAEAMAYDVSSLNNPNLVSVFSSGNAGSTTPSSGVYNGLAGFSNLTGNFKMAKNIITVGAIDSFYAVSPLSSKGPAFDGRIKPELVAFGEDGSSGAAAMVSGAAALVQQAYRSLNNNVLPQASLVKAVLINSADDIGSRGPDFRSGYGSLNVHDAVTTVLQQRAGSDSLQQGEKKIFPITVPEGSAHLKVTVSWTDRPAAAGAEKALVNDLHAVIRSEGGQTQLPWLLSHAPSLDSLLLPPARGVDTLNNTEQIFFESPAAGKYTLEVSGAHITGTQVYSFAYHVQPRSAFSWTFPGANDPLEAGKASIIRWQTARKEQGLIQWTTDGATWTTIANIPDLASGFYRWNVPDVISTAQLRVLFQGGSSALSDTFVISPVLDLSAGYDCPDSFLLHWNRVPANEYSLYELQGNYLQPFEVRRDTFTVLNKTTHPLPYYAVSPLVGGKPGKRSFTLNYRGSGVGCYVKAFFIQTQTNSAATFQFSVGTTYSISSIVFQKSVNGVFRTVSVMSGPSALEYSFRDDTLAQGENSYRVQINLQNGQTILSEVLTLYHLPQGSVLLYPNPVVQGTDLKIATNKAGRISLEFIDNFGNSVLKLKLANLVRSFPSALLSKGLYVVRITEEDGSSSTQKLVVY
ncbi:MAG TPA: S8 family peptidase, partial [Flavisolibacter sp.]|nr:S8 family peptidase [Flavisolibacter sp.]